MGNAKVVYKDIAVGADRNATVTSEGAGTFSDVSLIPFEHSYRKIATNEKNLWALDGTFVTYNNDIVAFWSNALSDENGNFVSYPQITLTLSSNMYTSLGISFVFGTNTEDYCTDVVISWYADDTLIDTKEYNPDSVRYFCENRVDSYNKVVCTFKSMNKPCRRLKVDEIIFGVIRIFNTDELRSTEMQQECNLICDELPISTISFNLDSKSNVEYLFQSKQPLEAYDGTRLIGIYYIKDSSRKADKLYTVNGEDAFGILDQSKVSATLYTNANALDTIRTIVDGNFIITEDGNFTSATINGCIPDCTKREAIQQICFAIGACASTMGIDGIKIFKPNYTNQTVISNDRIFLGTEVETVDRITAVKVTAHTLAQDTNGVIDIGGVKYTDTTSVTTINNPDVISTDKPKVVSVENFTLITTNNIDDVSQRVYNYVMKRNTLSSTIILNDTTIEDYISLPTQWGDTFTGNIEKMTIKLSNMTIADMEVVN